jgi:hypothetical protein
MSLANGAAPATASTVSGGQIGERVEGLTNTRPKPNPAIVILRTVAELFPVFTVDRWLPHKPLAIFIDKALIATRILKPFEARLVLRAYTRRRVYHCARRGRISA